MAKFKADLSLIGVQELKSKRTGNPFYIATLHDEECGKTYDAFLDKELASILKPLTRYTFECRYSGGLSILDVSE